VTWQEQHAHPKPKGWNGTVDGVRARRIEKIQKYLKNDVDSGMDYSSYR
jgi:hypothetical protein